MPDIGIATRRNERLLQIEDDYFIVYGQCQALPEKNLVAAILGHAIRDMYTGNAIVRREARTWMMSSGTKPFTFSWCCYVLDLDPKFIRIRALALRREWFGAHRFRG